MKAISKRKGSSYINSYGTTFKKRIKYNVYHEIVLASAIGIIVVSIVIISKFA